MYYLTFYCWLWIKLIISGDIYTLILREECALMIVMITTVVIVVPLLVLQVFEVYYLYPLQSRYRT